MYTQKNRPWLLTGKAFAATMVLFLTTLLLTVSTQAAEFYIPKEGERVVDIVEPAENAYVAGDTVNVNAVVRKDLIVAGDTININASVFRSVFAAGDQITFNLGEDDVVQGSVRVAGNQVVISGNFVEDVIVAGDTVKFENARIIGDVYVAASNFEISNSQIGGNFGASLSNYNSEAIDQQVTGEVVINQEDTKVSADLGLAAASVLAAIGAAFAFLWLLWTIAKEVSFLVVLLTLYFTLKKYNKLEMPSILFDGRFGKDFGIGFLVYAFPVVIAIISFLVIPLVVLPLMLTLAILFISLHILSQSFLPIYMANFLKNVFKWNLSLGSLTLISYLVILLINVLAFFFSFSPIGWLFSLLNLVVFVFGTAAFGFALRKIYNSLVFSLKQTKSDPQLSK